MKRVRVEWDMIEKEGKGWDRLGWDEMGWDEGWDGMRWYDME